jgi:DNA-binding NarL/FixJ family response regulator
METTATTVKALIFERRPRLAIGITNILERSKMISVIGRLDNPQKIEELIEDLNPDVFIIDADHSGCPVLEVCSYLKRNYEIGIVLLSTESQQSPLHEALTAGADSIISKPFHPRDLVLAVVHAAQDSNKDNTLAVLPEIESRMKADKDLSTGRLAPLIDWADRAQGAAEEISPRLKPKAS